MSKQYLAIHTIDDAHPTDIFSLAVRPAEVLSASGSNSIKVFNSTDPSYPLSQTIENAHPLGCHHLVTARDVDTAASTGFAGEVKIWKKDGDHWKDAGVSFGESKVGDSWACALTSDGQYMATTTFDGRTTVWELNERGEKVRDFESTHCFGMCIDISADGAFTATGHQNGSVFVYDNESGKMMHSLNGLTKPVRTVSFSPLGSLLAAAGDSKFIALYDVLSGEQFSNLMGHSSWISSVDWSGTGEFLLSGSFDGKVKVWSIDRRECVATHAEADKTIWSVKWLPRTGKNEGFATVGANRSISFYREASGS